MALTAKNQLLIAFKKLVGKAHTNVKFGDSNESVGSNIQIDNSTIFSQPIPASPSSSLYDITNNIVEKVQFDLISIPLSEYTASFNASSILSEGDGAPTKNVDFSSGIHAFALKLPSNYETLSSNLKKGTGYFVNNQSLSASNGGLQIVPEKYNVASYAASVSSSSGIISFTDEEDYILDSYAGILFLQDINRIPTSVTAYLYVGDYLTERVSSSLGQFTTLSASVVSASSYVGIPSSTPGGANTQIQFNSGSTFSGSSNLIYDYTTNILSGTISQFTTISASVVTSSNFIGDGNNITNITASNISNFTNDVRAQFSEGTNITIVNGVISSTATTAVGGVDKQIQFNSGSSFSGSSNLTYDYATGEMQLTGNLIVSGTLYANEYHTNIISSSIIYSSGSTKFGDDSTDTHQFTGSILGGIVSGTTAQFTTITGSVVSASTYVGLGNIAYITSSTTSSLSQIEIADFSNDVAVTFVDGRLKFIFGSPTQPSTLALTFNSTFNTDRFNKITDNYDITGSWNNGQYTIVTGAIYEGSTKLAEVNAGSSVTFNTTTSGSHTYTLQYTASSPLDGSLFSSSVNLAGTLAKTNPDNPTITITAATIELGVASDQIEQGATGSISFTSASANPSNGWNLNYVSSNYVSPLSVVGSLTGSSNIQISASAFYSSPTGDNDPNLNITTTSAIKTYTKIRSLRYGASTSSSFTAAQLEDIRSWDTTLGGTIGTIDKGNTNPSGDTITIDWTGEKYHYIIYDSARPNLTSIVAGTNVISAFNLTTVGNYKVYRTTTLQAYPGQPTIYTLT
jgi:hypothetical protein